MRVLDNWRLRALLEWAAAAPMVDRSRDALEGECVADLSLVMSTLAIHTLSWRRRARARPRCNWPVEAAWRQLAQGKAMTIPVFSGRRAGQALGPALLADTPLQRRCANKVPTTMRAEPANVAKLGTSAKKRKPNSTPQTSVT